MNTNLCRDSAGAYVVRPSADVPQYSDTVTTVRSLDGTYQTADEELGTFDIFRAVATLGIRGWLTAALVLAMLAVIAALVTVGGAAMAGGV